MSARNSRDSPGVVALPSAVTRLRTSIKQTSHTGARWRVQLRRRPRRVQASDELPSIHCVAAQLQRCASCCSAWRGASDTHVTTAPPGETSTPTHGAAMTQAPDARHSCCSAGSGDRRVLNEKNRSSLHRGKTKKPDCAQTSARPTAVLLGQECARSRHTRTPSGATRWSETPPRRTQVHPVKIQAAPLLLAAQTEGQPPLPSTGDAR